MGDRPKLVMDIQWRPACPRSARCLTAGPASTILIQRLLLLAKNVLPRAQPKKTQFNHRSFLHPGQRVAFVNQLHRSLGSVRNAPGRGPVARMLACGAVWASKGGPCLDRNSPHLHEIFSPAPQPIG